MAARSGAAEGAWSRLWIDESTATTIVCDLGDGPADQTLSELVASQWHPSAVVRRNGYAAGLNVATPQGAARMLQASLRIPAPQLVAAVAELKALGRVEAETQNGEEVTQQHADLLARLKNSRETEQRLQDVLRTRTGKVKDVLEVEGEIARVRGEIEQMEAEQQTLEHRVNFATIDLKLAEEYKAQLTTPAPSVAMQVRNATVNGFRSAFQIKEIQLSHCLRAVCFQHTTSCDQGQ